MRSEAGPCARLFRGPGRGAGPAGRAGYRHLHRGPRVRVGAAWPCRRPPRSAGIARRGRCRWPGACNGSVGRCVRRAMRPQQARVAWARGRAGRGTGRRQGSWSWCSVPPVAIVAAGWRVLSVSEESGAKPMQESASSSTFCGGAALARAGWRAASSPAPARPGRRGRWPRAPTAAWGGPRRRSCGALGGCGLRG